MPQLTADHLFVVATSRPGQPIEEQPTYKSFVESPLFKQLPASRNNHVYMFGPVPENYYTTVETLDTLAALVAQAR